MNKHIHLLSHIDQPNQFYPVPSREEEVNLSLYFENKDEELLIRRLADKRDISVQTLKIIYNLYFNSLFKSVTTSEKKTIYLGHYFKFLKIK